MAVANSRIICTNMITGVTTNPLPSLYPLLLYSACFSQAQNVFWIAFAVMERQCLLYCKRVQLFCTQHEYTEWVYIPLVLILGVRSLLIFSFKRRPFYSRFPLNSRLYGLNILFVCFGQVQNSRWESKQSCFVLQPVASPLSTLCHPVSHC